LKCQPGSKEEQVNGFVNMVMRRIKKGCSVCHVVFVFQHNTPIGLMKCTLNNVYRAILTRYDRDPRKSDNAEGPWFFLWPDVPGSAAEQHALNEGGDSGGDYVDGIHYYAVVIIPLIDKRRWKGTFKGFIDKHGWCYLDKYLIGIWSGAIFMTSEKVVSYVAKAWCRGHVDYDDVVILPLDKSELPDKVWAVDQPVGPSNIATTGSVS
jgi:hypothetical protein